MFLNCMCLTTQDQTINTMLFVFLDKMWNLIVFPSNTTHQGQFIVLGHYIKNIHPGKKHNRAIITMT
jgi:hypothetical protein